MIPPMKALRRLVWRAVLLSSGFEGGNALSKCSDEPEGVKLAFRLRLADSRHERFEVCVLLISRSLVLGLHLGTQRGVLGFHLSFDGRNADLQFTHVGRDHILNACCSVSRILLGYCLSAPCSLKAIVVLPDRRSVIECEF